MSRSTNSRTGMLNRDWTRPPVLGLVLMHLSSTCCIARSEATQDPRASVKDHPCSLCLMLPVKGTLLHFPSTQIEKLKYSCKSTPIFSSLHGFKHPPLPTLISILFHPTRPTPSLVWFLGYPLQAQLSRDISYTTGPTPSVLPQHPREHSGSISYSFLHLHCRRLRPVGCQHCHLQSSSHSTLFTGALPTSEYIPA